MTSVSELGAYFSEIEAKTIKQQEQLFNVLKNKYTQDHIISSFDPPKTADHVVTVERILDKHIGYIKVLETKVMELEKAMTDMYNKFESGPCGNCGRYGKDADDYLCSSCRHE